MNVNEGPIDGYSRISQILTRTLPELTPEQLVYRPSEGANSIAWLVWHLTRIQDHHLSDLSGPRTVVGLRRMARALRQAGRLLTPASATRRSRLPRSARPAPSSYWTTTTRSISARSNTSRRSPSPTSTASSTSRAGTRSRLSACAW